MQFLIFYTIFQLVKSQQPITFPLISKIPENTNQGCSVKSLEETLIKWSRKKNDTLLAYDCFDQFRQDSKGFIEPRNAIKRNQTIMFQKTCSFKCSKGHRFYNQNRELKGRKKMIKVFCNSWKNDKRSAKWRVLEKYENWSCKFRGSEGLGVLAENHVSGKSTKHSQFYPVSLIPMETCAFKDFLKKNNAMAVNRILISTVRNWRGARFGPYDILSIQQSSIHEEREHHDPAFDAVYSVKSIHNSSLIYRKDRLKLKKTAELVGHKNFEKYYGVTLVAMHFKRLHTYPGMMKEFSVLLFRSSTALREFDLAPFLQTMSEKNYPIQTVVQGSLPGRRGCLKPLEDNAFTLLTGKKNAQNCQHVQM